MNQDLHPIVAVIMGSQSDWKIMQRCTKTLEELAIPYSAMIISAHRTPQHLYKRAERLIDEGFEIVIAGAGMAAALPGLLAALTILPVIGVPIESPHLKGMDSLLSIVQMPKGVPIGCMAINGAENAALFAAAILSLKYQDVRMSLTRYRDAQSIMVEMELKT